MAATVFNQAQLELLDMMQWVKSPEVLAELKQVISDFFAKKGQEELDAMGCWLKSLGIGYIF